MKKSNSKTPGLGATLCGLLAGCFVALKLCGVIGWSWWWVLSPILIPLAIITVIVAAVVLVSVVVTVAEEVRIINEKRRRGQ